MCDVTFFLFYLLCARDENFAPSFFFLFSLGSTWVKKKCVEFCAYSYYLLPITNLCSSDVQNNLSNEQVDDEIELLKNLPKMVRCSRTLTSSLINFDFDWTWTSVHYTHTHNVDIAVPLCCAVYVVGTTYLGSTTTILHRYLKRLDSYVIFGP